MGVVTKTIAVILLEKVDSEKEIKKFEDMFQENEVIKLAYVGEKCRLIFTNKRIIITNDKNQKKVGKNIIPYSEIRGFKINSLGLEPELKIYTSNYSKTKFIFSEKLNLEEINRYLQIKIG